MLADYVSHETVPLNIELAITFMFKRHGEQCQMIGKFIVESSATFLSIIKINIFCQFTASSFFYSKLNSVY